jgi:succinate-semialdehyde dehydrogenase/glutarate-semialdehyde dehydrogenase
VPQCAIALENAFLEADFDQSEFTNIFATHDQVSQIIADKRIQAVKFTGGTPGGMEIAS